ncbi:MBL fold metallo-hydrolase [Mycobacterium antarcticum]|uniref:MBL fold metallo-hydrolase n=1 Tax=Mycolicibacterium sp. TUM20985 TaxID=3023370 RepID=UPI002573C6AE|nr:MBL fold metallo-hydrolase [Mycolicibacterium sp. TUM20985]BDX29777.1 MBL fold metallo-hydrolase [Mycolicibacterium sp. TUM20985]
MTDRIKLGNATVTRVLEWEFEVGAGLFGETPAEAWQDEADLLVPTFYDPATDRWRVVMQSWVIDVDGLTVVVDTGVGNDRDRPHMPPLAGLSTDFLGALRRAGVAPEEVDVVVNTHLHTDHVGWNTTLGSDGRWVPTFPNARYLIPEADYRFFAPDGPGATEGSRIVMADSIFPVEDQMQLWSDDLVLSESLRLRPAAGHTPGSSALWLDAGRPAVFVGDLTHCPIQIPRPDDPCGFDVDPAAAATARKRVFTEASRSRAAVIPAHYPGHGGATLVARGDRFEVDDWLGFAPI